MDKPKKSKLIYLLLLSAGFLGLAILDCPNLNRGSAAATVVWILAYLGLTCGFRSKRQLILSAAVFCVAYLIRFMSAVGMAWLYFLLFPAMALVIYGIFLLYSFLLNRWNRWITTLAFPAVWTAVYFLAILVRFPALIRVDVLFTDLRVLMQAERLIGSTGMAFVLLWIPALLHFAVRNRRLGPAAVGVGLGLVLFLTGTVYLYPNVTASASVRVAYTTGPYIGDYLHYTTLPPETCAANMESAAAEAAAQGADILVFSEEAFEIPADGEDAFLERCSAAARGNGIHMLVGLDVENGAANGKSLNKIVWVDADGTVSGSYVKTKLIPVLESDYEPGDGVIPSHTVTVDGNEITVSYLICYDSNFPAYVGSMDEQTDILFLPSWDWEAVTELHSRICRPLAVENRVSILKCTYDGVSLAVNPDGEIIHSTDTDDVGFGGVHTVDIPVEGKAGSTVQPPAAENYVFGIIAAEVMSMLVCLILLYGSIFESREKSARNRLFSVLVFTCLTALVSDAMSWILDGCARLSPVLYVSTFLSMALTFVLTGEFIVYLTAYIEERRKISHTFQRWYMVFASAVIFLILLLSADGQLFYFENGVYRDGACYSAYVLVNIATVLLSVVVFAMYGNLLSLHDIIATGCYIIIPSAAALLNVFIPEFSYAYPAVTLSLIVIYVMLQSDRFGRLKQDEQMSHHMASHDELTGLLNRRAFNESIKRLSDDEEMMGVLFADVNGLKYTNDTFGHEAGDRLLVSFAEMLSDSFRKEEIFRISGDEFVVIMADVTQEAFLQRTAAFERTLLRDDKTIACIGTEYGRGRDIVALVRIAETHMYERKEAYHQAHPETKRI